MLWTSLSEKKEKSKRYIMNIKKIYSKLCSPAQFYVVVSLISLVILGVYNFKRPYEYTVGDYSTGLSFNNLFLFVLKLFYIVGWTWVLNKFCHWGWSPVSWLLVLMPFMLFFIFVGILMYANFRSIN